MSPEITAAELIVMEALWAEHPARSGEILRRVAEHKSWTGKTVNTLIRRLVDKGALGFDKSPGGFLYFPLVDRDEFRRSETRKLVDGLFDGNVTPLLACFSETESLSESDLEQLRTLVAKLSR